MKSRAPISLSTWIILLFLLWRIATLYPRWNNTGTEATISWDVFGYYLYLPATFIYDDLWGLSFVDEIFAQYQPAGDFHHAVQQPHGAWVMKYPIGMALLYLPFFLLGHLGALLSNYPADGFSFPYQLAVSMGSLAYAGLGLWLVRRLLLRLVPDQIVAITLGVLVLATNYLNYVSFDGAMPHNALFTLYALILTLTIAWHARPSPGKALLLGLTIGLATIVRPIELMALLLPLLWTVKDRESFQQKVRLLWQHRLHVLLLALGMILMGMIQLIYWKKYAGHFFYYSYGEYGFDWLRPHLIDGLFSYRKGWLVYTPVMILALAGFVPLFREKKYLFWPLLVYLVLNIYVVYSWEVWWYGGSFGSRAMIQAYAVLSLPLALCIHKIWQDPRSWLRTASWVFLLLCTDINLLQTYQAHAEKGGWRAEGLSRRYYWKIFGRPHPDKADKKYLDIKEELGHTRGMEITRLYENGFENDSTLPTNADLKLEGERSLQMGADFQYSPGLESTLKEIGASPGDWIRAQVDFMYVDMEWNEWQQCQLVIQYVREGDPYRGNGVRMQRLSNPWQWHHLQFELKVPRKALPGDVVKVYVWNATSNKPVYIDNLRAELIRNP